MKEGEPQVAEAQPYSLFGQQLECGLLLAVLVLEGPALVSLAWRGETRGG